MAGGFQLKKLSVNLQEFWVNMLLRSMDKSPRLEGLAVSTMAGFSYEKLLRYEKEHETLPVHTNILVLSPRVEFQLKVIHKPTRQTTSNFIVLERLLYFLHSQHEDSSLAFSSCIFLSLLPYQIRI